jgi:hypothetical protein
MTIHVMDRPLSYPARRRRHWQKPLLAACGVGLLWNADAATTFTRPRPSTLSVPARCMGLLGGAELQEPLDLWRHVVETVALF